MKIFSTTISATNKDLLIYKKNKCNRNMNIHFYLILFIISSLFLLNTPFRHIRAQELENTYVNENCGVSINYLQDWKAEQSDFVFEDKSKTLADINTQDGDIFTLNIAIENMGLAKKSMDEISEFMRDFITMSGESEILSSEITEINGFPAYKVTYVEGVPGKYEFQKDKFHTMEVLIIAHDREYLLTFEETDETEFDKYAPIVEQMVKTIKITQPHFEGINC